MLKKFYIFLNVDKLAISTPTSYVTGAIEKMGGSMDDETQAILGDVGGIVDGIGQMAQGYATMNPAQMTVSYTHLW